MSAEGAGPAERPVVVRVPAELQKAAVGLRPVFLAAQRGMPVGRSELISALHGVRLCGSVQVIAAAESLVAATSDLELNEKRAERFQRQAEAVVAAQGAFLDTCREDLAYTARWWQLLRRRKERRFLDGQAGR